MTTPKEKHMFIISNKSPRPVDERYLLILKDKGLSPS